MKSLLFVLFFASAPLLATDCRCVGLAGNFPGYTLFCDDSLKARFPFNGDEVTAGRQCEAARVAVETGQAVKSSNCDCRAFPGNYMGVVLFHTSEWGTSGIKRFQLYQNQLDASSIRNRLKACSNSILELFAEDVCQP